MRPDPRPGFVVENKPGAFGILAIEEMARARPDGYTLQVGNPGTNVLTPIIYKNKFKIDYDKDVTMVTRLGEIPLVLAATTKDFAPKTYAEFIAYAKANPGKVRYASVGVGSNNHYDTEAFAQWAGIKLHHIPNKGGGAAITNDCCAATSMSCSSMPQARPAWSRPGMLARAGGHGRRSGCRTIRTRRRSRSSATRPARACGRRSMRPPQTPRDVLETLHKADRAGAQRRAGADRVQEADDQGGSQCLDRGRAGLEQGRDRALEEDHRGGEGRAAG